MDANVFSSHFIYRPPTSIHSSPSMPSPAATFDSPGMRQNRPHSVNQIWPGHSLRTSELSSHASPASSAFSTWASSRFLQSTKISALRNPPPQVDAPSNPHFPSHYYPAHNASPGSSVFSQGADPSCGRHLNVDPTRPPAGLAAASPNLHHPAINYSPHSPSWYSAGTVAAGPGLGNPDVSLEAPYAHGSGVGALLPQQRQESLGQVQDTLLPIPDTDQSARRLEGPSLNIVIVDPNNPSPHRGKRRKTSEEEKKQKEESRLLKECGGACVWCYLNKKKCDPGRICAPCNLNNRGCFRDCSQLWLYMPVLEKSKKNRQDAKERTFQCTYDVLSRLKKESSPQPFVTQVVANIRWSTSESRNLLAANITKLRLPDCDKTTNDRLISSTLANIQVPELDCHKTKFVDNAGKMLKLLAAIVTLSRSRVHVPPANVGVARSAMFFVLTLHVMALCEASADFCAELWDIIRRKESHQDNTGTGAVNPLWLAIGIYHKVIDGLISFQPGPLISDIFDNIKPRLDDIRSHVHYLLMSVPPYQGSDRELLKESMVDDCLSSIVPKVPVLEGGYDVAFWVFSETQGPISTVISRQEMAYDQLQYEMGCLLDKDFDVIRQTSSGKVPGSSPTHFRPFSPVDRPAVNGINQGTSLTGNALDGQQFPLENDGAYASHQSSDMQTNDDTLFSDWTYHDQYSETSGFTLAETDGLFHGLQIENECLWALDHRDKAETLGATNLTSYASTHHIAHFDPELDL
ncbi:hypothetical protein VTN77DRAFT_8938 [Rasamsonia byssochlamydoides]|uniref:uncharacterized protein n=1 Tax=Rasamsonia byssochlamydoides TaxID=89139 RepID=UPI0037431B1F